MTIVTFRLEDKYIKQLKTIGNHEARSLSNTIRRILIDALTQRRRVPAVRTTRTRACCLA